MASDRDPLLNRSSADEDGNEFNEKIPLLPGLDVEKASAAFEPATIEEESQLAKGDGGSDSAETSEDEDEYAAKLKHPLWDNIIVAFRKTFSRAEWMLIAAGLLSSIIVSIVDPIIYLVVGKIVSTLLKHQTITDGQFSNAGEALFGSLPQVSTGGASTTGAPIQSALFGNISRGNSSLNGTGPGGETLFDQALVLIELGAALGVAVLILNLIERLCFGYAAVRQQRRLMLYSVRKLIDMDISWMETRAGRRGPASLLSQTQKNSDIVYSTVSSSIPMVLNLVTSTGVAFGMALWLKWDLALLLLLFIPFIFLLERWYMKAYIKLRLKETHALLRSITVIHEAFLMFSTVISFNGQSTTIKRYMDALAGAMKASIQRSLVVGFADGGLDFLYSLIYIFGMWYGAVTFDPKTQEPGDLLATVMIMNHVCSTASSFRDLIDSLVQAIASIEELREIWDATPEIECPNGIKIDKIEGSIVLQDVFFSYPTRRKVPVLNGINLVIEPGKSVAVVGDSGSGKSTLVAMVMRFYGTTDGELLINSMSARGIDIATLRARIGYVSQEPILFNTSIKENVLMGNPDATDAELTNALRDANALEFVKKLPKGWNTNVGESGIQLSGGQKQRVAIARALIRQPDLLVFDEATSALDSHNEQAVQKAIENATRQCSTLIIAHRLSTVARCDTIVVMKEGKIIESGSPDQLIEQRGVFHSMLDTQRIADVSQTDTDAPQKLADPMSGPDAYDALRAYVTSDGGGYQKSRKHGGKQAARRRRRHKRIYYGAVTDVEFDTEYKDDDYRVAHRLQRAHSLRRKHARRNTYDHLGSTITLASMPLQAEEMGSSKSLSGDALEGTFKEPPKAKWKIGETHKRNWWPIFRILLSTSPLRIVLCFFSAMPRAVGLLAWAVVLALQLQAMALEPDQMIHTQLMIALYWVAISVVKILVEMLNHWIFQDLANVSTIRLREELVTSFFRHGCGWFEGDGEGKDSSTLTIRLGTDVGMLRMAVNDEFMQLGTNIWCCLCAVIFSLVLNWRLAIASLSLYSVFVITMLLDGRYHRLRTEEVRPVNERNAKIMTDGLTHVRTTKAYGLAQYFFDKYVANFDIIQKMRIKMMWVSSLVFAIRAAFMYLYFSSNLFIGSTLIDDGLADVRQIWAITLLTEIACNRMLATFTALNELFDCMLAADRLGKLYTAPVEYDQMSTAGVKPIISGFIRLKSVTVRYPTRPQVCALKRCDLLVDGCKETAIVGPSGGGKSTVIKLLNRLYEFDTGTVTVDGINIRDINLAHLRQSIVPVNQEPQLFAISLHENIVYGLDEELATRENAVRAAKMANIHDFIVGLPKGYETYAGKLGGSLSGGQKQRIALARAFARRPRVLLLDEATSALDSANEQMIVNSVAEAMKGSTVVTVAHRLSTVQHADRINVLMDGAVTESGTHQQLMKAQRMYHDMCRRQMDFT